MRKKAPALYRLLRKVYNFMGGFKRELKEKKVEYIKEANPREPLELAIREAAEAAEEYLFSYAGGYESEKLMELFFGFQDYLRVAAAFEEGRYCVLWQGEGRDFGVRLFCIDASGLVEEKLKLLKSAVLFSATLSPFDYYINMLCRTSAPYRLRLESPFPPRKPFRCSSTARFPPAIRIGKRRSSRWRPRWRRL